MKRGGRTENVIIASEARLNRALIINGNGQVLFPRERGQVGPQQVFELSDLDAVAGGIAMSARRRKPGAIRYALDNPERAIQVIREETVAHFRRVNKLD
jgi:hypothetical protein